VETFSRGLAALAVGLVVCLVGAPAARAQGLPSEAPLPSCLDQTIKGELGAQLTPRGVQKRNFIKNGKLALHLRSGLYGGDLTSSSWIAGGGLTFWFTEDFGLEASFDITPIALELDSPLAEFFGDDRFTPGLGYLGLANVVWSPIHAKLRAGGGIIHTDILFYAGGGRMFHDSVQGVTLDAGFAIDLFITKVVTFRFDVKDVMAVQEAVAETRFTNNIVATAGLTFWIPTPL
jgi:outer membrane beta-barrel protein